MRRVHAVVTGVVQGVGMRWSCAREAERHGVSGWVRNLDDGTVEVVLEGDDAPVAAMLGWLREGPPHARVADVVTHDEAPRGARRFDIR
ncbi:acylphosphatase [Georgenia faecalis]|uniref:Acylphosphatase n=1 Tax=Georgenia faecalis TaxID=2483799 RepID=A0ABV9D642_9MICO|nr:acylphosphatase [Georgenia faecalis]